MDDAFLLSTPVIEAVAIAQQKAREYTQARFSGGHLLWGLLQEENGVQPFVEGLGKDLFRLRNWAEFRMEHYPKTTRTVENPPADEGARAVFKEADNIRSRLAEPQITPLHLLQAICTPEVAFTAEQLRRFPISLSEFGEELTARSEAAEALAQPGPAANGTNTHRTAARSLDKYCDDLTARARQGKIDPVVGRDKELKQLMEILGKRLSPNVLLIGEPGVGKTAIIGGLALHILAGKAPSHLKDATIFELDVTGRLVAGAYKGEVEQRLKDVLKAVKEYGNKALLFIDEIHTLLDENGSVGSGAVNLLKPELARGELTVIGATTQAEYQKFIQADEAFRRRFTVLPIHEPNEALAIEMLRGLVPRFEKHHSLQLAPEAVAEAVHLAKRYLADKNLPVSAIEVIDYSMSAVKVMNDTSKAELASLQTEWEHRQAETDGDTQAQRESDFGQRVKNFLSHILVSRLEELETHEPPANLDWSRKLAQLASWSSQTKATVEKEDVTAIVAYLTGIPMGKIQSAEQGKLQNLEAIFRQRVVGQEQALNTVADALRRSRAGLKEPNKPAAVFFFLGPTGTGKTELAKAIAESLFNDESALIRFDMSEFKEEHSVALLYGSPPGYIGYREGGLLVNKIRQRPYSVVLFDEIEKAHQSIYDVFLQILDEGSVRDKLDRKGDFTNAVVIFTSNVGAETITDEFEKGLIPSEEQLKALILNTRRFRPELLGRSMDIIPFAPISKEVAPRILELHLANFTKILRGQGIGLALSAAAKKELVHSGFSPVYGARPLKETIRRRLGNAVSNKIIAGEVRKGDTIQLDWDEDGQNFRWEVTPERI